MARPLRIQFPGAMYHIISRGNGRMTIYHSEKDWEKKANFLITAGTSSTILLRPAWLSGGIPWITPWVHIKNYPQVEKRLKGEN